MGDGIVSRTCLSVAAVASRCLVLGRFVVIGCLDLREFRRVLANTEKLRFLHRKAFPHDVLSYRHATRAIGRSIGERVPVAFEEGADIIGGPLAMMHGHNESRTAESPVTGSEHLFVDSPHALEIGFDAIRQHQAKAIQFVTNGRLPDRSDDHIAGNVVLGSRDIDRLSAAIGVGFTRRRLEASKGNRISVLGDGNLFDVVSELDALLDGTFELNFPRWYFIGAAPIDDFHVFAAGQAQGDAAGIHGDIAAADDDDVFRQLRAFTSIDTAQERYAVDNTGVVLTRDTHRLTPPRADCQQHGVVAGLKFG